MERVAWFVDLIEGSDEEGEEPLIVVRPDDGSYGLRVGEFADFEAMTERAVQYVKDRQHDHKIPNYHFQISPWISVREAEEEYGVPRATLTWACRQGKIVGAEKLGNRWRFPLVTFRTWMRKRRKD